MFDGFDVDAGFDAFGLDDFGDVAGFDGYGFGFGGFGDVGGFDPAMTAFDGMGLNELGVVGGADFGGLDLAGFDLNLGFENLGYGSDLDDVILAPDMAGLIDLDLSDQVDLGFGVDDATTLDPQSLSDLPASGAMGPGGFGTPFLPASAGGVAMTGGAAAGVGPGLVLPGDALYCPTDRFTMSTPSPGRFVAKLAKWSATKGKDLAKNAAGDMAKDEVRDQVKKGAKAVFAVIRGASTAAR